MYFLYDSNENIPSQTKHIDSAFLFVEIRLLKFFSYCDFTNLNS